MSTGGWRTKARRAQPQKLLVENFSGDLAGWAGRGGDAAGTDGWSTRRRVGWDKRREA